MEPWTVVGTVASVLGFFLGIWVLCTTIGARKAAQDALSIARRRGLVEELEEASQKVQQIGDHTTSQDWGVVRVRSDELIAGLKVVLSRWQDGLSEGARDDLLMAGNLISSIKQLASESVLTPLTDTQKRKVAQAQTKTNELVGSVLGEARRREERNGN